MFRFSMKILMSLALLASAILAYGAAKLDSARKQRVAVMNVEHVGGFVRYDYEYNEHGNLKSNPKSPTPAWLHRWLGEDEFASVVTVNLDGPDLDDDRLLDLEESLSRFHKLEYLSLAETTITDSSLVVTRSLPTLQYLNLDGTHISGEGLRSLENCGSLRELYLVDTDVGDDALAQLGKLKQLERLDLEGTRISDAGLRSLAQLQQLQDLVLDDTAITDNGLAHLSSLVRLKFLGLVDTQVTDAGLVYLEGLDRLKDIALHGTHVTQEGRDALRSALGDDVSGL